MDLSKAITIAIALLGLAACGGESETTTAAADSEGAKLVKANCQVCHANGINGAPIIGNAKMWSDRVGQGVDVLTQHAIEGYGLMPPKGGKTQLSDEQIRQAVEYMVGQVQ